MTQRLIYGKEVKIKAHDINLVADNALVISSAVSPNYKFDSTSSYTATVSSTGARVVAIAATVACDRVGLLTRVVLSPILESGITVPTAADATSAINFAGAIPLAFRPPAALLTQAIVTKNNVAGMGYVGINTNGDITVFADLVTGFTTFTATQLTALNSTISIAYYKV